MEGSAVVKSVVKAANQYGNNGTQENLLHLIRQLDVSNLHNLFASYMYNVTRHIYLFLCSLSFFLSFAGSEM